MFGLIRSAPHSGRAKCAQRLSSLPKRSVLAGECVPSPMLTRTRWLFVPRERARTKLVANTWPRIPRRADFS